MNEEDYEVDEQGKKKVHKFRLSVDDLIPNCQDDKKTPAKTGVTKQKRKRSPSPPAKGAGKRKR